MKTKEALQITLRSNFAHACLFCLTIIVIVVLLK